MVRSPAEKITSVSVQKRRFKNEEKEGFKTRDTNSTKRVEGRFSLNECNANVNEVWWKKDITQKRSEEDGVDDGMSVYKGEKGFVCETKSLWATTSTISEKWPTFHPS